MISNKLKLTIKLIDTDSMDENNVYYLYEVNAGNRHYYKATSDEELDGLDTDTQDYSSTYNLYERSDFTEREWEIAKYLFNFLWDSSNGTNTCVEQDIYEDDGFTREEIEQFAKKFDFNDGLEEYEDGGFEIYWSYFERFDLNTCDFWENYK